MTAHTLGWLGTGRMGGAMASRLLMAGHSVAVWNRTQAKAQPLARKGATVAGSIAELATRDIVFVMVSTPRDLEEVVLGGAGLLTAASRPAVIVDCSTVDVESSRRVREAVTAAGSQFLAAPVSGNPHVVSEGGAILAVSGPRPAYDMVRPYLDAIGKMSVYVGDQEQARLVKLCSNLYLGLVAQSLSEVTALAEKAGVPRPAFLDFLNSTVLGSDWTRKRTPDLLALDWTPTFTTELLRKDFDLGLAAARQYEVTMPLAGSVFQLLQAAIGRGYRDADFLSLFAVEAASSGMNVQPQ
jgi:3-hydroxyisobutyrate dehydrogenase-like beta-hydroxyacid dehydrogenase